jgi:hypothetical protein
VRLLFAERQRGAPSSASEKTMLAAGDLADARQGFSLALEEEADQRAFNSKLMSAAL